MHRKLAPEYPGGNDGQHRRGVPRHAGDPLFQRRNGADSLQSTNRGVLGGIGVEVVPTGTEAVRGESKTANPMYRVRWGMPGGTGTPTLEATEFSKLFSDPANPEHGFAALMVCGEADAACPVVKGAAARISMPYLDPKIYDGGAMNPPSTPSAATTWAA